MPTLKNRILEDEVMDQPGLDPRLHSQALTGLKRLNWWSATASVLWHGLEDLVGQGGMQGLRVVDFACGGGDNALRLARQAAQRNVQLAIHGYDRSQTAVDFAREQTRRRAIRGVEFFQADVLSDALPHRYDVAICTLFLHHLNEAQAVQLLQRMSAAARLGILVDDLRRTRLGYFLAWAGGRLLTRSPVVHVDGPLSVRAAFSTEEVRDLAIAAGLQGATIHPHWPQRFLLSWRPD